jgi:molybdopterin molybdotransferase
MASKDEFRARIVGMVRPLAPLELPLADARGCVLSEAVLSPADVPGFPTVTVEGFAARVGSYEPGASLRVVDEVPAGFRASEQLNEGTCIKVWPGAPLPEGSDTVIPVDLAQVTDRRVVLPATHAGKGFLAQGSQVGIGEQVAPAGSRLTPELIGHLARSAVRSVRLHPRPRVLAFTMGSEFVEPGVTTPLGLVSDYLSFQMVAIAEEAGALAFRVPAILDDLVELETVVDDNCHRADLILITGVGPRQMGEVAGALRVSLESAEEFTCAIGEREGTVLLVAGADASELSVWGSVLIPSIIEAQMGVRAC